MPQDSLDFTFATIMKDRGLEPHFYRARDSPNLDDESDYVTKRARKTHDLYHILSGFNMDVEVGVIDLNVSQY